MTTDIRLFIGVVPENWESKDKLVRGQAVPN